MNNSNVPPYELNIKVGQECYIMRNFSPDDGLLNNTAVRVIDCTRHSVKVVMLDTGVVHYIPRINFTITLRRKGFSIMRKQFPLRPGYAKTINRSQGLTLNREGLDLREEPFYHGQLFVALSRVRSSKDIIILTTKDNLNPFCTKNVVYQKLLE